MNNPFTVEETNLICIFQSDSRTKVIEDIHKAMKHIDDDELVELSVRVAGKLESMGLFFFLDCAEVKSGCV